ncbi:MAG: hypothetical protein HZB48_06410 [Actinobacteria bacterium]|uniref:hypothetical protein n=1 Tax=Propionicimonas sp. T2.31MG-18 TaxID=3157620 RepID=UPI0035EB6197|nr:hypothetical protein [Actinomycetota bacterium]
MPHAHHLGLALSYLSLAADQLLAAEQESPVALFAGVECLEIQSQVSELGAEGAPVVTVVPPGVALALAADLLSLDGRAELAALAQQLHRLSKAVS